MKLTHSQKKFIKKHRRSLRSFEIAERLNLPLDVVNGYLPENAKITTQNNVDPDYQEDNFIPVFLPFVFIACLIFIVYFNAFHAGFSSDDIDAIVNNPTIRDFSSIRESFFNLRLIILVFTYKLFHLTPIAFRLANLLFHFGSATLVYLLGNRLYNQKIGLIAAILFAVHPAVVESVTWISGGGYTLYTFFLLAAFYTYLLGRDNKWWYGFSLALFIVISATKGVIFPLIPLSYELTIGDIRKHWKKSISYISVSFLSLLTLLPQATSRVEMVQAGTTQAARWENPLIQFPYSISSYLELFFFPLRLTHYHTEPLISIQEIATRWIITIVFFVSLIFIFKRNRHIFFWFLFFFIVLAPVLTPLRIAWTVAERYMYPAVAGLSLASALAVYELLRKKRNNIYSYSIFVIVVILLMTRSIVRNIDWQSDDSLWLATVKTSPNTALIHFNLGRMYQRKNQLNQAETEFKKALQINSVYAEAVYELGQVYFAKGMYDSALEQYKKTLTIRPTAWQAYQNMGAIYYEQKLYKASEDSIIKAIELNPDNPELYFNLSLTYANMNQSDKMQAALKKAEALEKKQKPPLQ